MTNLITTGQAAEILGKRQRTIHRMVARGELKPAMKFPGVHGRFLFLRETVEEVAAEEQKATGEPALLYRLRNEEGSLLYVGVTRDLNKRLGMHRRDKAWYPEIASITSEPFDSRVAALAAERRAIQTECPAYNYQCTTPPNGFEKEHWTVGEGS